MSNGTKYLLARTFYWIAGTGATITFGVLLSVLALAQTQGEHTGRIYSLEHKEIIHPVPALAHQMDHDKLIAIGVSVKHIESKLDDIMREIAELGR